MALEQLYPNELTQDLPPMAQALLQLDERDRQRRQSLAQSQGDRIREAMKQGEIDPFNAAISAYAGGNPMNPWAAGAQGALEAQAQNAKMRQAAELKIADIDSKAQESDLMERMAPALLRQISGGRNGSTGTLPNGNTYIKSGTRFFEVLPNKDNPQGYDLKEIVSAEKTILGADPTAALAEKQVEKIFKTLESGGAFVGWSDEELEAWHDQTYSEVLNRLGQVGRGQAGVTPSPSPTVNAVGSVAAPASPRTAAIGKGATAPTTFPMVSPEVQATRDNAANTLKQRELQAEMAKRDQFPLGSAEREEANRNISLLKKELSGTPSAVVKSGRDLEQGKGYGHQEGVDLAKERKGWGELYQNSSKLENNLTTLKQLYSSNADIASGEAAPVFKSLKSGLESMGIKLGESPRLEDVISSMSTNMALHSRTAEGTNLLPGAMSNYEDQLLQKIQPSLMLTTEGRLQLIDFMAEIARSNRRMAEAATAYEKGKGRLDAGWNAVRERKAKEEMARLAILNRRIMAQYGSKK